MNRKAIPWTLILIFAISICCEKVYALEITEGEIINALSALKEKLKKVEEALQNVDKKEPTAEKCSEDSKLLQDEERGLRDVQVPPGKDIEETHSDNSEETDSMEDASGDDKVLHGGERGIRGREEALEKRIEGIDLSVVVEFEGSYERTKPKDGPKIEISDLALSTVDLAVDARITDQLRAHVLLDYAPGEGIDVDEAIIHFRAEEVCAPYLSPDSFWYASIGKMDVPFGYFESHFISDTLTLELGETKETALVVGGYTSLFNLAAGVFNGNVDESGGDARIEDFVGVGMFTLPEDIVPKLRLMSGVSYTSNIVDSSKLSVFVKDEFEPETIEDHLGGASAFLSVSYSERYYLEAEWVKALDTFKEDRGFRPEAWNLEFAFRPIEALEIALRYGGSDNSLDFLPKTQLGAVAVYELFENTSIGLEYLFEELGNGDETTTVTTQLAIEFD